MIKHKTIEATNNELLDKIADHYLVENKVKREMIIQEKLKIYFDVQARRGGNCTRLYVLHIMYEDGK